MSYAALHVLCYSTCTSPFLEHRLPYMSYAALPTILCRPVPVSLITVRSPIVQFFCDSYVAVSLSLQAREGLIKDPQGRDIALPSPKSDEELVDYEGMLISGAVAQRRG